MSLVATCKDMKIDPYLYLRDIFDRIAAHPVQRLDDLLPDRWLESHRGETEQPPVAVPQ